MRSAAAIEAVRTAFFRRAILAGMGGSVCWNRVQMTTRYACPCCECLTLLTKPPGSFELCPVCYWEDDGVQFANPTYEGGANLESLATARSNFRTFGASSPTAVDCMRAALSEETPDPADGN